MHYVPTTLLLNGDMTTTVHSNGVDVNQLAIGSISAVWTGTPVGTLSLEVSNDYVSVGSGPNNAQTNQSVNVTTWSDYTNSHQAVSGPGNFTWNLNYLGFRWIRLTYTPASGTGSITVQFSGKG